MELLNSRISYRRRTRQGLPSPRYEINEIVPSLNHRLPWCIGGWSSQGPASVIDKFGRRGLLWVFSRLCLVRTTTLSNTPTPQFYGPEETFSLSVSVSVSLSRTLDISGFGPAAQKMPPRLPNPASVLTLIWVLSLIFCEIGVFRLAIWQCGWPKVEQVVI